MTNLIILIDGCYLSEGEVFSPQQLNNLIENQLIKKVIKNNSFFYKLIFVGCVEFSGTLLISLPYGYTKTQLKNIGSEHTHKLIVTLIKAIKLFENHYTLKNEVLISGKLAASFYLLDDYESKGLLIKSIKLNSNKQKGVINWSKTINKGKVLKLGASWIYINIVRRSRTKHDNHELTLIHKWAIHKAISIISIVSDDYNFIIDDFETTFSESDVREIALKLYPRLTNDREIHVLDMILQLLNEQSKVELSAIYTKSFNLIWEHALQNILGHNRYLKEKIPKVKWNDDSNIINQLGIKKKNDGASPEVDIIFENSGLHVLDAKYYDLFNKGNRPGLTDMWKQFYYGQAYKAIFESNNLPNNGFIFPCFMPNSKEAIKAFSFVSFTINLESGKTYQLTNIPAYAACVDLVLDAFIKRKSLQSDYLNALSQ